ncbi:hypothetical protein SAMD00024442_129_3 [Candidatus Symbiothrix dinenymphae]|nr:hypothetical protein SAMD00024442_129_3 [Candidatus Symbiothrix dinenymphae]
MTASVAMFVASCGGGNSPADIEKSVYSQIQKGNYEKGVEILFDNLDGDKTPTAEEKMQFVNGFSEKAKQSMEAKGGVKSFEIVEEVISEDGASATVKSKITYGDGSTKEESSKYVNKDGKWKFTLAK